MSAGSKYVTRLQNAHSSCFYAGPFFRFCGSRFFERPRIFLLLLPVFFSGIRCGFSQAELTFSSFSVIAGDSVKFSTGLSADVCLNSNSLNNNFFHRFNKNGFISDDIKDEISQKLTARNRIGADLNYGIFFSQRINPTWNFLVHISDRAHLDARFPKDLFDLAFYGNRRFAGDTAFLDNTSFEFLRYQQIQAGLVNATEKGNRFGFALSYLKGEENLSLSVNRARLVTDERGESLDADLSFEFLKSDTSDKGMDAFNGWGVSSDLFSEFKLTVAGKNALFRAEINDIGFIRWNENAMVYKADTSLHFEGVFIRDIFQVNDSVLKTLSPDTISDGFQSALTRKTYTTFLPSVMRLSWMMESGKVICHVGISHRLLANYALLATMKGGYKISPFITASGKVSYGGYGKFSFGMEMNCSFRNYSLVLGTGNLDGFMLKKYSGGNSGYLSFRKEF